MFKDDKNHETQYCKNCLELTKQLEEKEQECEELKQWKKDAENLFRTQTDNADKIINRYKQALDEIEKFMIYEFSGQNQWVKKNVLDIINKAKGE